MITLPYDIGEKVYALNELHGVVNGEPKRTPISIHTGTVIDYSVSSSPIKIIIRDLEGSEWDEVPIENVSKDINDLTPKLIL